VVLARGRACQFRTHRRPTRARRDVHERAALADGVAQWPDSGNGSLELKADRIRVPMCNRFFYRGWLVLATAFLCFTGCNKPKPNAPTQDFAQRYRCPVKTVTSAKEGSDQMRVTGCGESELYVRRCGNRGGAMPANEGHQPLNEADAKSPPPAPAAYGEQGCAWSRQQKLPAPPPGSPPQPKWLSDP
jgi:hypothetical protein